MALILFLLASPPLPTLQLADSLFVHGSFREAATEYERHLFVHGSDPFAARARCQLVRAYAQAGELERAERLLSTLPVSGDSLGWNARLALALGYLAQERSIRAQSELADLLIVTPDSARRQELNRHWGWLAADEGDFREAGQHFDRAHEQALAAECRKLEKLPLRNPDLAGLFSSFVPGTGELYAGNLKAGLSSLLVTAAMAAGIGYSISRRHYLDSALLFSIFFVRFYYGSRNNARDYAEDYNRRVREQAARSLKTRFASTNGSEGKRE